MHKIQEPYRSFIHEAADGQQILVTVWPDLNEADICTRNSKHDSWIGPLRAAEVWE